MALVTAAQFDITPNVLGSIAGGQAIRAENQRQDLVNQQMENAKLLAQKTEQENALARAAIGVNPQSNTIQQGPPVNQVQRGVQGAPVNQLSQNDALLQLAATNPERFESVNKALGLVTDQQKQEAADFAFDLKNTPFDQRKAKIEARTQRLLSQNRSPLDTQNLMGLDEEAQNAALTAVEISTLPVDKRIELTQGPELTSLQKNIAAAGFTPGTPEFQNEVLRSIRKPTATQVNISQGGESVSAEQKEFGKLRAKEVATLREEANAAESTIASLDILENIDVETGALEPAKQAVAAVAEGFGINADGLANVTAGEAFNAESKKLVLKVMATQKGPQTDTDRREIEKTIANLGNTKAGNQFIINSTRALAERTIERRDFVNDWIDENGSSKGANKAWNEFKRDTPMVSRNLRTPEGLPVFFYKFKQDVMNANPDASQAEVLEAWRQQDKRSK